MHNLSEILEESAEILRSLPTEERVNLIRYTAYNQVNNHGGDYDQIFNFLNTFAPSPVNNSTT